MVTQAFCDRLARTYSRRAALAGLAALVAVLWLSWMHVAFTIWPAPYWFEHRFEPEVDSPVIAYEFAQRAEQRASILQAKQESNPDPEKRMKAARAIRFQLLLTLVYAPLCAIYFGLFGLCYGPGKRLRNTFLAVLVSWTVVNWSETAWLLWRGRAALGLADARWLLLAAALILAALLVISKRPGPYSTATRRLLAIVHLAAGALILAGLLAAQLPWLAFAAKLLHTALVINVVGLLGPFLEIKARPQVSEPNFCEKRRQARPI